MINLVAFIPRAVVQGILLRSKHWENSDRMQQPRYPGGRTAVSWPFHEQSALIRDRRRAGVSVAPFLWDLLVRGTFYATDQLIVFSYCAAARSAELWMEERPIKIRSEA